MNNIKDENMIDTKYKMEFINNYQEILDKLEYYNDYFCPKLDNLVNDLGEYAKKLCKNAVNVQISNEKKETLGIISFYSNDNINNIGFLTIIVVDKKYECRGIGSSLIEFAENYCIFHGMKYMRLEVKKDNKNAITFYNKHGYCIDSENEKSYYMIKKLR